MCDETIRQGMKKTVEKAITLVLGVCVLVTLPMPVFSQTVQRLFSTPAARAELDRLRFQLASGIVVEDAPEVEPVVELPMANDDDVDVVYALGGTMRRADGSYTVWINNTAYDQDSLPAHIELLRPFSQGQLLIRDTGSGDSFRVKPGQVLNFTTGQLFESYQYDAVLAAAAAEAERIATEEALLLEDEADSVIVDSAAVEAVLDAAQDL